MKELDVVKLTKDYKDIKAGTIGTIVNEYEDSVYEVEFVDKDGQTIGVVTTPSLLLESVCEYGSNWYVLIANLR